MQALLISTLALHVLAAVFWAGSTFALARSGGAGAASLFRPQMGAALMAVFTGGYLWFVLHRQSFGVAEMVLGVGIVAAIAAGVLQAVLVGSALNRADGLARSVHQIVLGERLAAGLLGLTVICMATAKFI